ncbi:MAG: hypothetical protein K2K34_06705 [Oscillospiraceae bacterium]|nr:hypothetical protein [Oscillospiraceae bacterium]
MDKTVNKVLAVASAALLAVGIVFTGMNLFCGEKKKNSNNPIIALFCVSLSYMLNVIRDFDCEQQ